MKKAIFIGNSFIYYGGCVYTGKTWRLDEQKFIDYEKVLFLHTFGGRYHVHIRSMSDR